ncbi:hypothetical protein O181_022121 [Austropuccinia psidii MF-1]|uniref:Uncharacterized protein n=1 Tax=Austropuccinia psidii MF-1 TaxID=1389203 RepID=A0A9Q3CGT5_9BASI|nr:hypothetical protein [Austropuccinia psidii MF-1]
MKTDTLPTRSIIQKLDLVEHMKESGGGTVRHVSLTKANEKKYTSLLEDCHHSPPSQMGKTEDEYLPNTPTAEQPTHPALSQRHEELAADITGRLEKARVKLFQEKTEEIKAYLKSSL